MDWRTLPKVELHLHLDTSLSFEAAVQLKPSLTREVFLRDYVAPEKCEKPYSEGSLPYLAE